MNQDLPLYTASASKQCVSPLTHTHTLLYFYINCISIHIYILCKTLHKQYNVVLAVAMSACLQFNYHNKINLAYTNV